VDISQLVGKKVFHKIILMFRYKDIATSGNGYSQDVAKDSFVPENIFYCLIAKALPN